MWILKLIFWCTWNLWMGKASKNSWARKTLKPVKGKQTLATQTKRFISHRLEFVWLHGSLIHLYLLGCPLSCGTSKQAGLYVWCHCGKLADHHHWAVYYLQLDIQPETGSTLGWPPQDEQRCSSHPGQFSTDWRPVTYDHT